MARDKSPDVQLQVVITSRKIKEIDALPILNEVLASCGQDKLIPSIAWSNLHPLLDTPQSARFVSLMTASGQLSPAQAALLPRMIERFLSAPQQLDGSSVAELVAFVAERDPDRAKECLSTISLKLPDLSAGGLAQLKTAIEPALKKLLTHESGTPLYLSAQLLAARLGLANIDFAVIRRQFSSPAQPDAGRLQALDALIAFRDGDLLELLPQVLSSSTPQFVRRAFTALGRMSRWWTGPWCATSWGGACAADHARKWQTIVGSDEGSGHRSQLDRILRRLDDQVARRHHPAFAARTVS